MKKLLAALLCPAILLLSACNGIPAPPAEVNAPEVEPINHPITAEGKLLPATAVELAFVQGGIVADVLVQSGELVASGDVIARLVGIETVQAELAAAMMEKTLAQQARDSLAREAFAMVIQAENALLAAQKAYHRVSSDWRLNDLEKANDLDLALDDYVTAEAEYRAARAKLNTLLYEDETNREREIAQKEHDREWQSLVEARERLQEEIAVTQSTLTEKHIQILTAIANLERVRDHLTYYDENNLDREKLAVADVRLAAATARVDAVRSTLDFYELRAPFSGMIYSVDLERGQVVVPGIPVAHLADSAVWTVQTTDLAEIDILRVALDQNAQVQLDGVPGEIFNGKVIAIEPVGRTYLGETTYEVTIRLDEPDDRFLWNMTATVEILTGELVFP
ncbi:MAG: efflux RND transporter periplasmic adaptor subunit [Chloroflexota bacterium]